MQVLVQPALHKVLHLGLQDKQDETKHQSNVSFLVVGRLCITYSNSSFLFTYLRLTHILSDKLQVMKTKMGSLEEFKMEEMVTHDRMDHSLSNSVMLHSQLEHGPILNLTRP